MVRFIVRLLSGCGSDHIAKHSCLYISDASPDQHPPIGSWLHRLRRRSERKFGVWHFVCGLASRAKKNKPSQKWCPHGSNATGALWEFKMCVCCIF